MQAEYYRLSADRAAEIAACDARLTPEDVREVATADWPEGDEHQRWLDTAPAAEIADWVVSVGEAE